MSNLVPGFEYDIFISYRHNDNRSGWVTEFVNALQEELAATIKEPLAIYFDKNPHDGLLETHNVDKSLEGKLKCLIFIPIISQTYCDPKSFAWQQEFCTFNKLSKDDQLGRDIKLSNGNVASRILPVKIHDLDVDDKARLENEIGGVLRAIEFIYKEPGVNRPLKISDDRSINQNKIDYRNQVNKLANAIKELITAFGMGPTIKNTVTTQTRQSSGPSLKRKSSTKTWIALATVLLIAVSISLVIYLKDNSKPDPVEKKRIAILPFKLIGDKEGEYFASGMKEILVRHLRAIESLWIPPSLTSTDRFIETTKSHQEIANELKADFLIEASTQKWGDSIRLFVELIDPFKDNVVWSGDFKTNYYKVFEVQETIATKISNALGVTLSGMAKVKINRKPTENIEAYDQYLQGKQNLFNLYTTRDTIYLERARQHAAKAIHLDPNFAEPYFSLALTYMTGGDPNADWKGDSIEKYLDKGLKLYPESGEGLNWKSQFLFFIKHDTTAAVEMAKRGIENDIYDRSLLMWVGFLYHYWFHDGREVIGLQYYLRAYYTFVDDKDVGETTWNIGIFFSHMGDFHRAESFMKESLKHTPDQIDVLESLATIYLWEGNFKKLQQLMPEFERLHHKNLLNDYTHLRWSATLNLYSGKYIEGLKDCEEFLKHESVGNIFSIYTMLLYKSGKKIKAEHMWRELIDSNIKDPDPDYFMMARCYAMLGEKERALAAFEKIKFVHTDHLRNPFFCSRDLMLESLRHEPRFANPIKKEKERLAGILERVSTMEKEKLITIPRFIEN